MPTDPPLADPALGFLRCDEQPLSGARPRKGWQSLSPWNGRNSVPDGRSPRSPRRLRLSDWVSESKFDPLPQNLELPRRRRHSHPSSTRPGTATAGDELCRHSDPNALDEIKLFDGASTLNRARRGPKRGRTRPAAGELQLNGRRALAPGSFPPAIPAAPFQPRMDPRSRISLRRSRGHPDRLRQREVLVPELNSTTVGGGGWPDVGRRGRTTTGPWLDRMPVRTLVPRHVTDTRCR